MSAQKIMSKFFALVGFFSIIAANFIFSSAEAKPVEFSPHIFIDSVSNKDWFLNGDENIIFAGYGSPLFPNKKTHYIDYNSIKFATMKDGRLVVTCNFYGLYEFACFYQEKKDDGSGRARFMIRATVDSNASPYEVDSVLGDFNGLYLEPFPPLGTNPIPNRVAEMLYYMVKGEKFYGNLNPEDYLDDDKHKDILNLYTQDLYDRCKAQE